MYVQARLRKDNEEQVAWIESKDKLKVGSKVELLHEKTWWEVMDLYSTMDSVSFTKLRSMQSKFGASLNKELY